jgi:hypothetical protein
LTESARAQRSREHWLVLACALALPVALFVLGRALQPDPRGWGTHEQLGFRPCSPMSRWNVPCPGCGVTTSIALAARGRVLDGLCTQPFGLVALATALAAATWAFLGHARGRDLYAELPRVRWRRWGSALATLAFLAWVYKLMLVRGWGAG